MLKEFQKVVLRRISLNSDKEDNAPVPTNLNGANEGDTAWTNLVHRMITILVLKALLFFYSSCMHSFMFYSLARKHGLKPRKLDPPLIVRTLKGDKTLVNK